jgi:hypothetical protein
MAASFTIAACNNGFSPADARAATMTSVTAYREAMAEFAQMRTMDLWYASLDEGELMRAVHGVVAEAKEKGKKGKKEEKAGRKLAERAAKTAEKSREKAHTRDSLQALSKLGERVNGDYRIVSSPPVVVPSGPGRDLRPVRRGSRPRDPRAVPHVPGHLAR